MTLTRQQQIVVAVIPKISSVLSMFGSLWIIIEVLTDRTEPKAKLYQPYHRLLLGMSLYDVLENFCNFASTWPVPEGTEGIVWAKGNTATCSMQGYFLTLGVAIPIYNAMLSLYFLLIIKYKYSEDTLRRWIEPAMHLVAFVFAFGTATYSAFTGLYNNAKLWCWIAPLPSDCLDSYRYGEEGNCIRGDNAWIYRYAFYFGPLWFCLLMAATCMLMVCLYVRKIEASSAKYRNPLSVSHGLSLNSSEGQFVSDRSFEASDRDFGTDDRNFETSERTIETDEDSSNNNDDSVHVDKTGLPSIQEYKVLKQPSDKELDHIEDLRLQSVCNKNTRRSILKEFISMERKWKLAKKEERMEYKRTRAVFDQAMWYLMTFLLTHVWSTTSRAAELASGGTFSSFALTVIHSFFDPLQGFLNYFVYQRPRYIKIREKKPEIGQIGALSQMLRFTYMDRLSSENGTGASNE